MSATLTALRSQSSALATSLHAAADAVDALAHAPHAALARLRESVALQRAQLLAVRLQAQQLLEDLAKDQQATQQALDALTGTSHSEDDTLIDLREQATVGTTDGRSAPTAPAANTVAQADAIPAADTLDNAEGVPAVTTAPVSPADDFTVDLGADAAPVQAEEVVAVAANAPVEKVETAAGLTPAWDMAVPGATAALGASGGESQPDASPATTKRTSARRRRS